MSGIFLCPECGAHNEWDKEYSDVFECRRCGVDLGDYDDLEDVDFQEYEDD